MSDNILNVILLCILIVVLLNVVIRENFTNTDQKPNQKSRRCPKKYSKSKCSARFYNNCNGREKYCMLTKRKPVGYVALPDEMMDTSTSSDKKYLSLEVESTQTPPLCQLDNEGWTSPQESTRQEVNLQRQKISDDPRRANWSFNTQHSEETHTTTRTAQPECISTNTLDEKYRCRIRCQS